MVLYTLCCLLLVWIDSLGERARYPGDHATLYPTCNNSQCKLPIKFCNISQEDICDALSRYNAPGLDYVIIAIENCNDASYKCAKAGRDIPGNEIVDNIVNILIKAHRWQAFVANQ